ncbi:hypothetical protein ACHAQJ_010577 [Trichoderma viride]
MEGLDITNKRAAGAPFYTPAQLPPAGTALDQQSAPTLFKPYRMRGLELHNRFVVSPMCQYSAENGHLTDYHFVHIGQFALRGPGLIMAEATAIPPLRRITDFVHSQGTKIGIELAHAGRKATTLAPWLAKAFNTELANKDAGGWPDDVVAPSAIPLSDACRCSGRSGCFDLIEIHCGHGYLINEFMSPLSNKRTDDYGGSFENRTRILRDVIAAVRGIIPEDMPLWIRISATEWMEWSNEPSWDINDSICLAKLLPDLGVDGVDVSSGGNSSQQRIAIHPRYQTDLAAQIRSAIRAEHLNLTIAAVGAITETEMARSLVEDAEKAHADLVVAARQFLRDPEWVLRSAHDLNVEVKWPHQYERAQRKIEDKF